MGNDGYNMVTIWVMMAIPGNPDTIIILDSPRLLILNHSYFS